MFKLILKDFYLLKRTVPFIAIWLAFITISRLWSSGKLNPLLSFIPVFLSFILIGNAIALDEKYKMENLYCSLPLKRTTIVYAKYLSTIFFILGGIILSFLAGLFFPEELMTPGAGFFVFFFFALFFSVLLPINYRFGFQLEGAPGKAALVLLFITTIVAATSFFFTHYKIDITKINIIYLSIFLAIFVFLSLVLSLFFYNKRDL